MGTILTDTVDLAFIAVFHPSYRKLLVDNTVGAGCTQLQLPILNPVAPSVISTAILPKVSLNGGLFILLILNDTVPPVKALVNIFSTSMM